MFFLGRKVTIETELASLLDRLREHWVDPRMSKPRLKDRPELRKEKGVAYRNRTLKAEGQLTKSEGLFLGQHNCMAVRKRKGLRDELSYEMSCE